MIYEEIYLTSRSTPKIGQRVECQAISTATAIIIALAAISTAAGSYAAVSAGNAAEDASKYSAAVDRNNATIANDKSRYEAERLRKRNVLLRGKQQAAFAKSGVDISSGSAEDIMFDTAIEGALDIAAVKYAGSIGAGDYTARSRMALASGKQAKTASYYNAGATILSGASTGVSAYAKDPSFA